MVVEAAVVEEEAATSLTFTAPVWKQMDRGREHHTDHRRTLVRMHLPIAYGGTLDEPQRFVTLRYPKPVVG